MKQLLVDAYTFFVTIIPYMACQAMEVFVRGRPLWQEDSWFIAATRKKFLAKHAKMSGGDRAKRYTNTLEYIEPGSKVLDLGCGGGRLQLVLREHSKTATYLGVDFDKDVVEEAQSSGRNVIKMDFSNLSDLENLLVKEKPDVVFIMYAIDYIPSPEKIIGLVSRHCKYVIFGGKNQGHYVQRLRFLFGLPPTTGQSMYEAYLLARQEQRGVLRNLRFAAKNWVRDNQRYLRVWSHREYVAAFEDLGLDWKVLAYRGFRVGKHHKYMIFGSLRAVGIQYCLSLRQQL